MHNFRAIIERDVHSWRSSPNKMYLAETRRLRGVDTRPAGDTALVFTVLFL